MKLYCMKVQQIPAAPWEVPSSDYTCGRSVLGTPFGVVEMLENCSTRTVVVY